MAEISRYHSSRIWVIPPSFIILISVLSLSGTVISDNGPIGPAQSAKEISYEQGPVRVRIKISSSEISTAQTMALTIEADAADNCLVELPGYEGRLAEFGILGEDEMPPRLTRERRIIQEKTFQLEPLLAGEYRVPPLKIPFYCANMESDRISPPDQGAIETREERIRVYSLLESTTEQPGKILGPVNLPASPKAGYPVAILICFLLSGAILLVYRRNKNRPGMHATRSPHEIAYGRIEEIAGLNLPQKGESRLLFKMLPETVKDYVHTRFGLIIQECTTQEFLSAVDEIPSLPQSFKSTMREFMELCDRVKFALHQPSVEDSEKAIRTCMMFVDETKENGHEI